MQSIPLGMHRSVETSRPPICPAFRRNASPIFHRFSQIPQILLRCCLAGVPACPARVPPAQTVTRNHRSIPFFCVFRGGVRVVRVEKIPAGCSNRQTVTRKRRHKCPVLSGRTARLANRTGTPGSKAADAQTFVRKTPKIVPAVLFWPEYRLI